MKAFHNYIPHSLTHWSIEAIQFSYGNSRKRARVAKRVAQITLLSEIESHYDQPRGDAQNAERSEVKWTRR